MAHLLRMAGTADDRVRERIIEYADSTPDPPPLGRSGLATAGCPKCRRTMWQQQDGNGPLWVCASCGHVVEEMPMRCPSCQVRMARERHDARESQWCPRCKRMALPGESATEIEERERRRVTAMRWLDEALAYRTAHRGDPEVVAESWAFAQALEKREAARLDAVRAKPVAGVSRGEPE